MKEVYRVKPEDVPESERIQPQESTKKFVITTTIIMIFACLGLYGASFLLKLVTKNPAFQGFSEINNITPLLLGLKGCIEMTYASRLSTMANTGRLTSAPKLIRASFFNFALILAQAINISLFAVAVNVGIFSVTSVMTFDRVARFLLAVLSTALLASCILVYAITSIVYLTRFIRVNPDNICSPFAAVAGDSAALLILNYVGQYVYDDRLPITVVWGLIALIFFIGAVCVVVALLHEETREALGYGSVSIIVATLIFIGVGAIFNHSVGRHPSTANYQLILNGVGGNLVAILASKMSTSLHQLNESEKAAVVKQWSRYLNPLQMWKDKKNGIIMLFLLIIGMVLQATEITCITLFTPNSIRHPVFIAIYLFICVFQILILFYACVFLTQCLFAYNINPDNNSIPILTAFADLLGALFLACCLWFYKYFYVWNV
uniref:MgtE domain-containing protein n=1 Tax=Panagrellus redivivus TaxID=6233 RepID=A0A7E4ZV79_PANRE